MPDSVANTYVCRVLRVDLTNRRAEVETLDDAEARTYLGGTCLGIKYVYDKVRPGVEWNDPRNVLSLASGPLGGTQIGGSGSYSVVTKGPLTNGMAATQANGFFGAYLRFSGFEGIVLEGAASNWVYLYVHDGTVEFRDAAFLLGKGTFETEEAVRKDLGLSERSVSVASIGPAGENLVRFAAIASDKGHVAPHNGVGAVMGSKKLKAIAVARGKNAVPILDRNALSALSKQFLEKAKLTIKFNWGTLPSHDIISGQPTRNYQTSLWNIPPDKLARYSEKYIRSFPGKRVPCWACQFNHCREITITEGKFAGSVVQEPDGEQISAMGPLIDVHDVTVMLKLADHVDRLGLDNNEAGWTLGFVMECFEKGILTTKDTGGLAVNWGDGDAAMELLNRIARREGIGDLLAEGVMRAARAIGGEAPNLAIHTMKGNTPRTHDHRLRWEEMFATCVSNVGTLEFQHLMPLEQLGISHGDNFSPEYVSSTEARAKGSMFFEDSLGVCRFNTLTDLGMLGQALKASVGLELDAQGARRLGLRAVNMAKVFNLIHGVPAGVDWPSPRYGSTPSDGKAKGKNSQAVWPQMLGNYYRMMGWDASGIPLPETLKDLGLEEAASDLRAMAPK